MDAGVGAHLPLAANQQREGFRTINLFPIYFSIYSIVYFVCPLVPGCQGSRFSNPRTSHSTQITFKKETLIPGRQYVFKVDVYMESKLLSGDGALSSVAISKEITVRCTQVIPPSLIEVNLKFKEKQGDQVRGRSRTHRHTGTQAHRHTSTQPNNRTINVQ